MGEVPPLCFTTLPYLYYIFHIAYLISTFLRSALTFQVRKRVAVILREHLPDDFLPPPPIQTSLPLSESDQGNLVGNFLSQEWCPLVCLRVLFLWFVPRLIFLYI